MEFKERKLKGVYEINLQPHHDNRGFFMRTYDHELFVRAGLELNWQQENQSRSEKKGIIRGLHFQLPPYSETKLVRCIHGSILDVFVDLRENSDTFGQWDSVELSADTKNMVLIPKGFAHGFCTLTDSSEVVYKVDSVYSSEHECGIIWNDPDLNISWPVDSPILSPKDQGNLNLKDFISKYRAIGL